MEHLLGIVRMVAGSLLTLAVAAGAGVMASGAVARVFYGRQATSDFAAVVFRCVVVLLVAFPFLYMPVISWLKSRARGPAAMASWLAAAGIVPAGVMSGLFGLWIPGLVILGVFFVTAGAVLGLSHWCLAPASPGSHPSPSNLA